MKENIQSTNTLVKIRLSSQQLLQPAYNDPLDLVRWMGALQGQDSTMSKWAIAIRLQEPSLQQVDEALASGALVRSHVLRPTWHIVPGEDLYWMTELTRQRNRSGYLSWGKQAGLDESLYTRSRSRIERLMEEHTMMSKPLIGSILAQEGLIPDASCVNFILPLAELDGIICGSIDKEKKPVYVLLEKQIPHRHILSHEEALGTLARRYFQSHSPATLHDFAWWSGLSLTEARKAVGLISQELTTEKFAEGDYLIHQSCTSSSSSVIHFLPPYDEYLISYKERKQVLPEIHQRKAYTPFGIFYPVLLHNGHIVGNWKKNIRKNKALLETTLFEASTRINQKELKKAERRYLSTLSEMDCSANTAIT